MQAAGNKEESSLGKKSKGFISEVFGQFLTTEFWKEFTKVLMKEIISSAFKALGGVFYWYGEDKRNKDISRPPGGGSSDAANKAFRGGYAPNPSFFDGNAPSYSAPSSPVGDNRFPGF